MLEHGVDGVEQLDSDHDERLLCLLSLRPLTQVYRAPLSTATDGVDGGEIERLAHAYNTLGDYRRAIELCERNREALGSDATAPVWVSPFGVHAGVAADFVLAWALAVVGDFNRATAVAEEGVRLSTSDTAVNRLYVLWLRSFPGITRGQYTTALPSLEKGLSLARELNLFTWLPVFAGVLGYVYARSGRLEEGLRLLEEATIQAETRNRPVSAWVLGRQSAALLLAGQPGDARAVAQRGLEGARARGERGNEAFCLLALGEAETYEHTPNTEAARTHLQEAMVLATELGMRPLVAHCQLGLGKLYRRMGKRQQSQEHFTTAKTMYREMDMTYWLEQAKREMTDLG